MTLSEYTDQQIARQSVADERDRLRAFALSLLSPEANGLAVPAHVRDAARVALGREAVEAIRPHGQGEGAGEDA